MNIALNSYLIYNHIKERYQYDFNSAGFDELVVESGIVKANQLGNEFYDGETRKTQRLHLLAIRQFYMLVLYIENFI